MGNREPPRRRRGKRVAAALLIGLVPVVGMQLTARAGSTAGPAGFEALPAPQRILDTRPGGPTADGGSSGGGPVGAHSTLTLPVAGRVGLPQSLSAVALNVTVTEPSGFGFVTVYPCGEPLPTASNLNYRPGQTVPNAVISAIGSNGSICLYAHATTHLVVDVSGWFPDGIYTPLPAPRRLADTRPGQATADGESAGIGLRPAGSVLELAVAGRVGIDPVATSVALNVTATETADAGFVAVYPCGVDRPNASNLNYRKGETVPNLVVTRVGTGGRVCLYTHAAAHLVVDVAGSFAAAAFTPLTAPQRLLDTRASAQSTIDGRFWGTGAQPPRSTLQLTVAGRGEVPADASSVVLNVIAVAPKAPGFLTLHPRGTPLPTASNVNYTPGDIVANAVIARVGVAGEVCLFALAATDIVVDVAGWFTGPPPTGAGAPCPAVSAGGETSTADTLVRYADEQRGVGIDRIAVLACDIVGYPGADDPPPASEVAAWANANVTPWFVAASLGRYHPVFEAHPAGVYTISGPDVHPDWCHPFHLSSFERQLCAEGVFGPHICDRPESPPTGAPFTNIVMYTDRGYLSDGGPGSFDPTDGRTVLDRSPDESGRGASLKSSTFDAQTWIHEIGHTLHWPHSYIHDSDDLQDEYDNPLDIMSEFVGAVPQNTLAFNRLAAGWIDDTQVAIHRSGQANYTLDRPAGDGLQLVALPSTTDSWRIMTIEARPATGYDSGLGRAGVAVHLIDQSGGGTPCSVVCSLEDIYGRVSTSRRQAQALGVPYSYDHVLEVGDTAMIRGVTVSVLATDDGGYRIAVTGSYSAPSEL